MELPKDLRGHGSESLRKPDKWARQLTIYLPSLLRSPILTRSPAKKRRIGFFYNSVTI